MSNLAIFEFDVVTLDAKGQEIERDRHQAKYQSINLDGEIKLDLVAIEGGTFLMGSPQNEEGWHQTQSPQHQVSVDSFWIGKYPVTQAQWQAVAALPKVNQSLDPTPSAFKGANRPVEQITWYDAVEFCERLSVLTGDKYRLPSEAEWEYACRASTQTPFHFGETITTNLANYSGVNWEYMGKICSKGFYGAAPQGEDRRETTSIYCFGVANQFGLFDLHGNVREWCADIWHGNYEGAPTDGTAWTENGDNSQRVLRGGSWNVAPQRCRSAYRSKFEAEASLYDIGFRVAV